jgi:hypothetical protein
MKKITPYSGLRNNASTSTGDVLTPEKLREGFDYLMSDEYAEKEHKEAKFRAMGMIIAGKALEMELVTLSEYSYLMESVNINGGLIISKRMYDKILPTAEAVESELSKNEEKK